MEKDPFLRLVHYLCMLSFLTTRLISTNSHFYVIGGWLKKLFAEPGWRIEVTAGTGGGTTTAIPDGVCGISLIGIGEKVSP